jgi:hypothetical protein
LRLTHQNNPKYIKKLIFNKKLLIFLKIQVGKSFQMPLRERERDCKLSCENEYRIPYTFLATSD